jgi:hypothetical protein
VGRWRQEGRERRGEERGGGGEGSEGATGWLFCKSVSRGSVCKNNSNIEFFLLHVELNFNRRTYVKNIRTWFLGLKTVGIGRDNSIIVFTFTF